MESNAPAVKDEFVSRERIWIYILKSMLALPFPLPSEFGFLESAELTAWKEASQEELINGRKTIIITPHISAPGSWFWPGERNSEREELS